MFRTYNIFGDIGGKLTILRVESTASAPNSNLSDRFKGAKAGWMLLPPLKQGGGHASMVS